VMGGLIVQAKRVSVRSGKKKRRGPTTTASMVIALVSLLMPFDTGGAAIGCEVIADIVPPY